MSINFDNFNSVVSLFNHQCKELKDSPYLWRKVEGKFLSLSWLEVQKKVNALAKGLISLGILKGDRVVILSENRPEWQIADLAIMSIGGITVPAYTTSTTSDYKHIINHSEARCIIVSSNDLALKAIPATLNSKCKNVILIDEDKKKFDEPLYFTNWNDLIEQNNNSKNDNDLEENIKSQKELIRLV